MSDPIGKPQFTDRPVSVYDNLSPASESSVAQQRKDEGNLPLYNISFKFLSSKNKDSNIKEADNLKKPKADEAVIDLASQEQNFRSHFDANWSGADGGERQLDTSQIEGGSMAPNLVTDKRVTSDAKSKFFGMHESVMDKTESTHLINNSGHDNYEIIRSPKKCNNVEEPTLNRGDVGRDDNSSDLPDFTVNDNENFRTNREHYEESGSNRSTKCYLNDIDINTHPTQVVYMATTVPQNLKGSNIAGRHTPTRNSLRHSRMLVINKNYQGVKTPNPLDLRYARLARALLALLITLGVAITFLSLWILLWAPNTRTQDNPYWSGLILILSAALSLYIIRFRRVKRQKLRENCFRFLKMDSYMLIALASVLCFAAFVYASIHLSNLLATTTVCTSTHILIANAACVCVFDGNGLNNTIPAISDDNVEHSNVFRYRDLSCGEVTSAWKYILVMSIFLNGLAFLVTVLYLIALCCKKNKKSYKTVRSDFI